MLKKSPVLLALALLLVVMVAFTGCGGNTPEQADQSGSQQQDMEQNNVQEDKFPEKQITFVVITGVGGANDTMARGIQPYLQKHLGVPVVIENRPGSGGVIATNYVYDQPTDGYTLLWGANSLLLHTRLNEGALKFKEPFIEQFIPIYSVLNGDGNLLISKKDSSFKTIEDVAAEAQKRSIKVGIGGGVGSTDHVTYLALTKAYPGQYTAVPFDGSAESAAAVLGGHVDVALAALAMQGLDPKLYEMIAVTLDERSPVAPEVPTFDELGKPEMNISFHSGAFAPKGVPENRIKIVEEAFDKAFKDPEFQAWAESAKKPIGAPWNQETFSNFLEEFDKNVIDVVLPDVEESLREMQNK